MHRSRPPYASLWTLCAVLALSLSSSGCAVLKKQVATQPGVSGLLSFRDEPVAGVEVLLTADLSDEACSAALAHGTTNDKGLFSIPARVESRWRGLPGMSQQRGWRLCFTAGDEFRSWVISGSARPETPSSVSVRCDLARQSADSCQEIARHYP